MTAPERLHAAPARHAVEHWQRATRIRREWLDIGLATEPADRDTAERSLTAIYHRSGRRRPRFTWVDSPRKALTLLGGLPTHDTLQQWVRDRRPPGTPPAASDIAAQLSRLRSALDDSDHSDLAPPAAPRKGGKPWPVLPPSEALHAGVPLREVLRQGVRVPLQESLANGFYLPVRAALAVHGPVPVAWYGQQESSWIAYYDVLRRLGLVRYRPTHNDHLDDWAALAKSCGWWWPGEDGCVVVERPAVVRTEPVPGGRHDEVRLGRAGSPVEYRDGWRPHLM